VSRLPGDPSVLGKLAFAVGFRLPEKNRDWVRHELTDAGWRIRVMLRHLTIMIPVCVLLALLPGPPWLKIMVPALALAGLVLLGYLLTLGGTQFFRAQAVVYAMRHGLTDAPS